MKNIILILSAIVITLTSCEKVVDIDLKTSESKVVVEGSIVNEPDQSYVKLTRSAAYFDAQQSQKVTNADVKVNDGTSVVTFTETEPGVYKPASNFTGAIGRTYSLTVTVDGKTFTSQSTMAFVAALDSVSYIYYLENNADGKDSGYYVAGNFSEPAGFGNNYKLDVYQNGHTRISRPGDIVVWDDKYIDGRYSSDWELPHTMQFGDTVTLKMYSLDRLGFDFYTAMFDLANAGGLFGKTPANLPTNIKGDAFGYFGASAISVKSVVIK